MTVDAVAFDLDETLAVPSRSRDVLLREAVEATGAPPLTRQAYLDAHRDHLTARTREPIFAALLDDHDTPASADDLAAAYRERVTDALVPVEGAEALVGRLRHEYRVGLLTNGPVLAQHAKVRTLGWTDTFDAVLVTGSLAAGKPDSRAFEALLSDLAVDPGRTVYVGDDVHADVAGAAEAGLQPVQVCYPGGPDPDPRAVAHVDRAALADRLPDLLQEL